jgi:hypothetical protein
MKQSEPVNPKKARNGWNGTSIQESAITAELSGYTNLGMEKQALRITHVILDKKRITPEEFFQVIRAVGIYSGFQKWESKFAPHATDSQKFKRRVRSEMLDMYACLKEWETAGQFVSIRRPSSASDFLFGMDVLLELGKLEDAEVLATRCRKALPSATDKFEQSLLIEALACFCARTHRWDGAIAIWQRAPLDQAFRSNALSGIVEIHLARAFEAIQTGLKALAELKQNPELSLCVPQNDLGLTRDAEKRLLKFKRGIEKLLPEEVRKELGINALDES